MQSLKDETVNRLQPQSARIDIAALVLLWAALVCVVLAGCGRKPIVRESQLSLSPGRAVWAIAPAINLTGKETLDPLLLGDLLFEAVGRIEGVTAVPVNRTAEVMAATGRIEFTTEQDAALVAQTLGVDGIIVPTITAYDPYNPPMIGASLQLFLADPVRQGRQLDARELMRSPTAVETEPLSAQVGFLQASGVFDAADGSVRARIDRYARGREGGLMHAQPAGLVFRPLSDSGPSQEAVRRVTLEMDRYCVFVYHELLSELLTAHRAQLQATRRSQ